VLAATLAGLRSLRVTEVAHEEGQDMWDHFRDWPPEESYKIAQLQSVAKLIHSCSGLTELVLETADPNRAVDVGMLVDAWTPAAEGVEEVGEEAEQQQGDGEGGTAGTGRGGVRLPQLRHLEVAGHLYEGILASLLGAGGAAGLTSCKISSPEGMDAEDFLSLAACSGLQELDLACYIPGLGRSSTVPAQHPLRCSALTKLVLWHGGVEEPGLRAVCVATQLRHLDLECNSQLLVLPPDLSSLQQLTFLGLGETGVAVLPLQLGEWLPQLQVLGVEKTNVAIIPQGLQQQLQSLRAAHSSIPSVAAVQHLVGLQQLQLHGNPLVPPYQQLSVFTALQELSLSISEGSAQVVPIPLPLLRALRIQADDPWRAAGQLVGPGPHLTSLGLYSTWRGMGRAAAVGQLGVLPVLQQLVLSMPLASVWAAGPWLLQHSQLTSLSIAWTHPTGQGSQPAKRSLQQWCLSRGVVRDGLPEAFTQLTGLRVLRLSGPCTAQLPAWVSCLRPLRVLQLGDGCLLTGDAAAWTALGSMPLLRRVEAHCTHNCLSRLRRDAPHLFPGIRWSCGDSGWHTL
jgi:Leucine-rich repeat (LRR) protein